MASDLDAIDMLHDELFEDRPKKAGARMERIVGLVYASSAAGYVSVQQKRRRPGRRAGHWIDVDEQQPDGGLHIIECKHWSELVDQDVLNSVASRRDQLQAVAATVVSVRGFTAGAVDVAHDENIGLVRISRLAPDEHWHGILKEIKARGEMTASTLEDLSWVAVDKPAAARAAADAAVAGAEGATWTEDAFADRVEQANGDPAESVHDLLSTVPHAGVPGTYEHEVHLPATRYRQVGGVRLAVSGLRWVERLSSSSFSFTVGPKSPGVLLVQEVTVNATAPQRVVMDHDLRAWRLTDDGRLVSLVAPPLGE